MINILPLLPLRFEINMKITLNELLLRPRLCELSLSSEFSLNMIFWSYRLYSVPKAWFILEKAAPRKCESEIVGGIGRRHNEGISNATHYDIYL